MRERKREILGQRGTGKRRGKTGEEGGSKLPLQKKGGWDRKRAKKSLPWQEGGA